jgi:hypothetical protein
MRIVQRLSALLAWLALLATGIFLIAEGTGLGGDWWRQTLADVAAWIDRPFQDRWVAALVGVLIGIVALAVLVAQFVPMKLTQRSTVVERSTAGATRVGAAAVRRAVTQRIRDLPGVVGAAPIKHGRRLVMKVEIGQQEQSDLLVQNIRDELNDDFWNSLGTQAIPVDIHLYYVPNLRPTVQETV